MAAIAKLVMHAFQFGSGQIVRTVDAKRAARIQNHSTPPAHWSHGKLTPSIVPGGLLVMSNAAIHAFDFIDDTAGEFLQQVVGAASPSRRSCRPCDSTARMAMVKS